MSAYGPTPPRNVNVPVLPTLLQPLKPTTLGNILSIYHLTAATTPSDLACYLHALFQDELERGTTYPQEYPMTRQGFDAYFLANDLFVGVILTDTQTHNWQSFPDDDRRLSSVQEAKGARTWQNAVGGVYYVKPNYPGRSSHICNAGFLVPPPFRSIGVATALARSYLVNAPKLGYKASVFNLVYANNIASIRIWENLGFTKVGLVPKAGRLRCQGGHQGEEEYVDAWVVYKEFNSTGLA